MSCAPVPIGYGGSALRDVAPPPAELTQPVERLAFELAASLLAHTERCADLGVRLSVAGDAEVLVGLRGLVEADKEKARVEREIRKVDKDIAILEKKLGSAAFVAKAPPEVVAEARAQLEALVRTRARLVEALELASELK